jgi:hypothetical protein
MQPSGDGVLMHMATVTSVNSGQSMDTAGQALLSGWTTVSLAVSHRRQQLHPRVLVDRPVTALEWDSSCCGARQPLSSASMTGQPHVTTGVLTLKL